MNKVKITLVKSKIGSTSRQQRILESLKLGKMHSSAVHDNTQQISGMIRKVNHLVSVENV